jgi:hypothetical protein
VLHLYKFLDVEEPLRSSRLKTVAAHLQCSEDDVLNRAAESNESSLKALTAAVSALESEISDTKEKAAQAEHEIAQSVETMYQSGARLLLQMRRLRSDNPPDNPAKLNEMIELVEDAVRGMWQHVESHTRPNPEASDKYVELLKRLSPLMNISDQQTDPWHLQDERIARVGQRLNAFLGDASDRRSSAQVDRLATRLGWTPRRILESVLKNGVLEDAVAVEKALDSLELLDSVAERAPALSADALTVTLAMARRSATRTPTRWINGCAPSVCARGKRRGWKPSRCSSRRSAA